MQSPTPNIHETIVSLIQQLHASHYATRHKACRALIQIGIPAVPALLIAVQDRNWQVRANAADALASISDPESAVILYDMLCGLSDDSQSLNRKPELLRGLMGMGGTQEIARRIVAANYLPADRRAAMIELLRPGYRLDDDIYLHPLPTVSKLCEHLLHDSEESVRRGAATMLEANTLLRASQASATADAGVLLRAAPGTASIAAPEQLLRASASEPSTPNAAVGFWTRLWDRLFRR